MGEQSNSLADCEELGRVNEDVGGRYLLCIFLRWKAREAVHSHKEGPLANVNYLCIGENAPDSRVNVARVGKLYNSMCFELYSLLPKFFFKRPNGVVGYHVSLTAP